MKIIWKSGRDNSRTPMQWNREMNGGFSTGTPWLKVNPNYTEINVEAELKNPESIFHYYKKLIELRRGNQTLIYGSYKLILEEHDEIFAYLRTSKEQTYVILTNLFGHNAEVEPPKKLVGKQGKLLLSNYEMELGVETFDAMTFRPYEARVYQIV